MSRVLQKYLDRIMVYANRKKEDATRIRAEMEDHLRAVFKSLGDLILSLRQRTIDAEESEFIQS